MPPRAGRSRNSNYEALNAQSLAQAQVSEGTSAMGGDSQLGPIRESSSEQRLDYAEPYAAEEPHIQNPAVVEPSFIPDIPVSILADPRAKTLLKGSLTKLAKEAAPGAKLEDDAAELLLYVANDFLSSLANFSCRLASHRGSENLDARDVELYLERMHGMHISLAESPLPETPSETLTPLPATTAPTPTRKREPSPPLAQTRPRRHTNAAPPEEEEEEEDEEDGEDGTEGGDNAEEGDSDEEKPRESRRLRERAIAAEKQVKQRKRGKVGRPRK